MAAESDRARLMVCWYAADAAPLNALSVMLDIAFAACSVAGGRPSMQSRLDGSPSWYRPEREGPNEKEISALVAWCPGNGCTWRDRFGAGSTSQHDVFRDKRRQGQRRRPGRT